jgi:ornithine racemase
MSAPRLVVDLDKVEHNARSLVALLTPRGIAVTGVTKALLGAPEVAAAMLRGGVASIGDSRVENLERLRGVSTMLIRSPMLSQVDRVVAAADISCNSEATVLDRLGVAASSIGKIHGVMLMVELGDLREGAMPSELSTLVQRVLDHPGLALAGIGTNLACQSGVAPDAHNMAELSRIVEKIEGEFAIEIACVSGGNSANLRWALSDCDLGRVNHLRLGESILLGTEPLYQHPIAGLYTDAVTFVAEVIESQQKPSIPWGEIATTAFGDAPDRDPGGTVQQVLLAAGHQDIDPEGLIAPVGLTILGASSDHLVAAVGAEAPCAHAVGSEVHFGLSYSALLRAATSPFVHREYVGGVPAVAGA